LLLTQPKDALGLPLRYTEPDQSSNYYSPRNYGKKGVWEAEFFVDVLSCKDGLGAASFIVKNTGAKNEWEKAIKQPVCDGEVDDGASQQYTSQQKVHYFKCGGLTSFTGFNEDACYIGNV